MPDEGDDEGPVDEPSQTLHIAAVRTIKKEWQSKFYGSQMMKKDGTKWAKSLGGIPMIENQRYR